MVNISQITAPPVSAMTHIFQNKSNVFLKLLRRTFKTSKKLSSTALWENSESYVILTRNRSHSTNWPDTKLGPIDALNPKYPLPGYVGLVRKDKTCEVALIPAATNLPVPSTQHYVSVLSQAEFSFEEFEDMHSLVPKLDPTLEHNVHSCPELIKLDLSTLYPSKDFSGSQLTSISFHYSLKNLKEAENFEHIFDLFVQSALDVCASLNQMGYWADFMHPKTGIPYIGFHLQPNSGARLTNFGFNVNANGSCKVTRERLVNQRLFVGILFTDAPKDHPVIKHMQNVKSRYPLLLLPSHLLLIFPPLWILMSLHAPCELRQHLAPSCSGVVSVLCEGYLRGDDMSMNWGLRGSGFFYTSLANHTVLVTVPFIFSSLLYLKYFIESPSVFEKCAFKCAPIIWLATFVGVIRSYAVSKSYATLISVGLLFCSIGDICLVYDIKELFISGMIAFAIGHAFYTLAYGFKPLRLSLFPPFIIAFLTMNYHFAPVLRGAFVYAIPAYSFALSIMIWRAVSLAVENSSYSLALGCILFGISDSLLGINMFLKPLEHSCYSVMATYYLGQLGIAISTLSVGSKQKVI